MPNPAFGPFVLEHRVGAGGMAEVWRAHHTDDDVAVAIKVLTQERSRRPRSIQQFRQEIRAVARLDHPHVVGVHDVGEIPPEAAAASGGALVAGAPYLVMDLLPGGTLWRYRGRLSWMDLRNLLVVLLDALAHAHARGIIHRDLKPSNVLLSAERRAVLTDFGLAHLPDADAVHLRAGTPAYMAPEQFLDRWRDFGPWTDLYGFGCLVWTLTTGTPPYRRATWEETRTAHLSAPLPPYVPLQPVPEGLLPWLRGLLDKDPARRTQYAADALWALERIEPDDIDMDALEPIVEPDGLDTHRGAEVAHFGPAPAFTPSSATPIGRNDAPPPPPLDWRGARPLRRLHLRGAGLGLLGARALPTIGRSGERDALWHALVDVHRQPIARGVLLEGPAGSGKTHLARWLTQRAHEVGGATTLWVDHGARGANSGIAGMLRVHLGVDGLERSDAPARVADAASSYGTTDPADHAVLTQIVLEDVTSGTGRGPSVATPERTSTLSRHLCSVGARRPVILVVDDAHRGTDALLFARWLLRRREIEPTPVLVVLLVQDEGLGRHRPAQDLVAQIAQTEGVDRIRVDPLSDEEQLELIRELIGLEGEVVRRVATRTGGNPGFAVSLVEDWVARGVLVRAGSGYRIANDATAQLPDDLHALWASHLDHALTGWPEPVWQALELAAVLGVRVDSAEWQRIASRAGLHPSLEAVESLVARRLVVSSRPTASWRFVHGMVRESLLRRAEEGGRTASLHQLVLSDLEGRPAVDDQRMARHLLGAGYQGEGVDRILQGARGLFLAGNPHGALDLCDQAESTLAKGEVALAVRWRRVIALQRARARMVLGRLDDAAAAAQSLHDDPHATEPERLDAVIILATMGILRGRLDESRDRLKDAAAAARRGGHRGQLARALRSAAIALHQLGDLDDAMRHATESRSVAAEIGEWATWAESTMQLAGTLVELGHLFEAGQVAGEAVEARERIAHPAALAGLLNLSAEIERRKGRSDLAVPLYQESLDLLDRIGSLDAVLPRLNLAAVHALDGRYGDAFRLAERCRRESALQGRPPLELAVRSVLLVAALGLSDPVTWKPQADRILELAAAGVTCESDAYALIGLGCRLLRPVDPPLSDALAQVVVDWAFKHGRQHAGEIAKLLGDAPTHQ